MHFVLGLILLFYVAATQCSPISTKDYWSKRQMFLQAEKRMQLGQSISMNEKEQTINEYLMKHKREEFKRGHKEFLPAKNFLMARDEIEKSHVFQLIRKMPKGAVLHAHDSAVASDDVYLQLTFMDNLYYCNTSSGDIRFQFAPKDPKTLTPEEKFYQAADGDCATDWKLVSEERAQSGDVDAFNKWIKNKFSLIVDKPSEVYTNVDVVWERFVNLFITVDPLITYKPAIELYWELTLNEYCEDNVMFLEIRSIIPEIYDFSRRYTNLEYVGLLEKIFREYKEKHPEFFGGRLIYAPHRLVSNDTIKQYIENMNIFHSQYPDFMAGFDLVGQEDLGKPLIDFADALLKFPPEIKFFFHAGETNWYGETDTNLLDAVILGTHRIGHGYAVNRHPMIMKAIKEKNIAIEVNPISNQVLSLVSDLRNHPAVSLFSENYPLVISNDDPAFWGSKGLSHDFYEAFMAFTSLDGDLRVLKDLALNSIQYSSLTTMEKIDALVLFNNHWDKFVDDFLAQISL